MDCQVLEHTLLRVALDAPLDFCFDYRWEVEADASLPQVGQLVVVPFGRREVVGMVTATHVESLLTEDKLRTVLQARPQLLPLSAHWLDLCAFAAGYYHRPLGEVMLPALPKGLRSLNTTMLERALKKVEAGSSLPPEPVTAAMPVLTSAQDTAVNALANSHGFKSFLLHGITGSGKTEVYLQAAAQVLQTAFAAGQPAQVLLLVPEINLTPQLENSVRQRFPGLTVVTLHSGLAEGARLRHWLQGHLGHAHILLGTRLSVLASLPHLKLVVVDEEHDPSYKQQEGLRYSARDLAIWRARQLDIPIVLGSATPSLETWHHAQSGRYQQLSLPQRAVQQASLPRMRLIDTAHDKPKAGLTAALLAAIRQRLERKEQSLLFLNRRGYAPVLHCDACGWISNCHRCTAFLVLHKPQQRLCCHHCSLEVRIPRACPTCGNVDLQPLGRGTQRIEESLQELFPEARLLRIDADSTRRKGSAQAAFESVHKGEVDILIGTQMVAKGHDFQNLTLVGVLNPDTALFSHDYRASERLFAQLMQVAGRAGRAAQKDAQAPSEVLIQTRYPQHPLYGALVAHDYERFANDLLAERVQASLPPFMFQALLRAEARQIEQALEFLQQAADCLDHDGIVINDPIPMSITRVANVERAQLLVECSSRPQLQAFLREWMQQLRSMKTRVRWSLEVDPADI